MNKVNLAILEYTTSSFDIANYCMHLSGISSEYPGSSLCVHSFELAALMIH